MEGNPSLRALGPFHLSPSTYPDEDEGVGVPHTVLPLGHLDHGELNWACAVAHEALNLQAVGMGSVLLHMCPNPFPHPPLANAKPSPMEDIPLPRASPRLLLRSGLGLRNEWERLLMTQQEQGPEWSPMAQRPQGQLMGVVEWNGDMVKTVGLGI